MPAIVPRFDFRIEYGAHENIGRTRTRHDDAHLLAPELAVFAVADGMGGHPAGDVAAKLALDEARRTLGNPTSQHVIGAYAAKPDLPIRRQVFARLRRAVQRANERVRDEAARVPERAGMGTTIDIVWLVRNHAFIAHAGDGRVYLARSRAVLQLTHDHCQLESLKASGAVRPSRKGNTNALTNAVGLSDSVSVDTLFVDLGKGDRLLLCTDGVHGPIASEAQLGELVRDGDAGHAARRIVERATETGRDNATAIVVEIGDRFVARASTDRGLAANDLERASQSALLMDLPQPVVLAALSAGVEVEIEAGKAVPRVLANDLVSYIVLDGVIDQAEGKQVGQGAVLFPEALTGIWGQGELPTVARSARLLRLRADDFNEVCEEPRLGVVLYQRLGQLLARSLVELRKRLVRSATPSENTSSDAPPEPET